MLYEGEAIKTLIPQRDPIMMVDKVWSAEGDTAVTGLTVTDRNYFLEDGLVAEPGLIEHIAQSASAFAGHRARMAGEDAPIGYIGEVKKFRLYRRPAVGEELRTVITMGTEVNGITLVRGEVRSNDELLAETQMKIFCE